MPEEWLTPRSTCAKSTTSAVAIKRCLELAALAAGYEPEKRKLPNLGSLLVVLQAVADECDNLADFIFSPSRVGPQPVDEVGDRQRQGPWRLKAAIPTLGGSSDDSVGRHVTNA